MYFIENYEQIKKKSKIGQAVWVDKTVLIEKILNYPSGIVAIHLPRKWGKTLSLSMLECFLTGRAPYLFEGSVIEASECMARQGAYSVIFFSFPEASNSTELRQKIKTNIDHLYEQLNATDTIVEDDLEDSLLRLAEHMYQSHKKKVMVLLDNCPRSMQTQTDPHTPSCLVSKMIERVSSARDIIEKVVMMGPMEKEAVYGGDRSSMDPHYEGCFGFSEEEIRKHVADETQICALHARYGGYTLGSRCLYHPISLLGLSTTQDVQALRVPPVHVMQMPESSVGYLLELLTKRVVSVPASSSKELGALLAEYLSAGCLSIVHTDEDACHKLSIPNALASEVWDASFETMYEDVSMLLGMPFDITSGLGALETMAEALRQYTAKIRSARGRLPQRSEYIAVLFVLAKHWAWSVSFEGPRLALKPAIGDTSYLFELYIQEREEPEERRGADWFRDRSVVVGDLKRCDPEYTANCFFRAMRELREHEKPTQGEEYYVAVIAMKGVVHISWIHHDYAHEAQLRSCAGQDVLGEEYGDIKTDDFKVLSAGLRVDKTLFIKDFLDSGDRPVMIIRPSGFGKSINLSMLYYFFSCRNSEEHRKLFIGTKIETAHKADAGQTPVMNEQGQYPSILLSFKDICLQDGDSVWTVMGKMMSALYRQYSFIKPYLTSYDQKEFDAIISGSVSSHCDAALARLIIYLYQYYKKQVVLLIDEYDTPFYHLAANSSWSCLEAANTYWSCLGGSFFMSSMKFFLEEVFNLVDRSPGFSLCREACPRPKIMMMGVFPIYLELNSWVPDTTFPVYSVLNVDGFSCSRRIEKKLACHSYFGFTEEEVKALMAKRVTALGGRHQAECFDEAYAWYGGYVVGGLRLFNPSGIMNYMEHARAASYWLRSENTHFLFILLERDYSSDGVNGFQDALGDLLRHKAFMVVDEKNLIGDEERWVRSVHQLMLYAGYLTVVGRDVDRGEVRLAIPNEETRRIYQGAESLKWVGRDEYKQSMNRSLKAHSMKTLEQSLSRIFATALPPCPMADCDPLGQIYMGLLFRFFSFPTDYSASLLKKTRKEEYKIVLRPLNPKDAGYIFAPKMCSNEAALEQCAHEALDQITEEDHQITVDRFKYYRLENSKKIYHVGLAFYGEKMKLTSALWENARPVHPEMWGRDGVLSMACPLQEENMEAMEEVLSEFCRRLAAHHDMNPHSLGVKKVFHTALLGAFFSASHLYRVSSHKEDGRGWPDVILQPRDVKNAGYIFELSVSSEEELLEACAEEALDRISEQKYGLGLRDTEIIKIYHVGLACYGEKIKLAYTLQINNPKSVSSMGFGWELPIARALKDERIRELREVLEKFSMHLSDHYEITPEDDTAKQMYHVALLGAFCSVSHLYHVYSHKEDGYGKHDFMLQPRNHRGAGYIFELKVSSDAGLLKRCAQEALERISEQAYGVALRDAHVRNIYHVGLAFYREKIELAYKLERYEPVLREEPRKNILLAKALSEGNIEALEEVFNDFLIHCMSYYDINAHKSDRYHAYYVGLLGVFMLVDHLYIVNVRPQNGGGSYDMMLQPRDSNGVGYMFELKVSMDEGCLVQDAQQALNQIKNKGFQASLPAANTVRAYHVGLAFCAKKMKLAFSLWSNHKRTHAEVEHADSEEKSKRTDTILEHDRGLKKF